MHSKPKSVPKFAFRKEYFGGILLNFNDATYELITPEEIKFLEKLENLKNLSCNVLKNHEFSNFIKKLKEKNIIEIGHHGKILSVNIRKINNHEKIPKNYLCAPLKVFDTYTRKCNLLCKHCYANSNQNFRERRRTISQTKMLIKKFYDVGVLEWNFTGGEPTVAHDLIDAIKTACELGMKVSLNSNGCWPSEMSQKILTSGVSEIIISLEGREKTNDKRRIPGAFKRTIETLNQIYEYNKSISHRNVKTIINTVIGKNNVMDVEFLVKLAARYGFNIKFVPLKPSDRASKNSELMLSTREYMEFAKYLQELRADTLIKRSGINIILNNKDLFCTNYRDKSNLPYPFNNAECSALTTAIDILPDGRVATCSFLMDKPEFIGPNILDVSVYDAWKHPVMERFRRAQKLDCTNCKFYMKECRGVCRSVVLLNGGMIENNKLIGKDPYCFKELLYYKI